MLRPLTTITLTTSALALLLACSEDGPNPSAGADTAGDAVMARDSAAADSASRPPDAAEGGPDAGADAARPDDASAGARDGGDGSPDGAEDAALADSAESADSTEDVVLDDTPTPRDSVTTDSGPDLDGDAGGGPCLEGAACTPNFTSNAALDDCTEGRCNALGACVATPIDGCCLDDEACAWLPVADPCQTPRCVGRTCTLVTYPGCCGDDDACDDGLPCSTDTCDLSTGLCRSCANTCTCDPTPVIVLNFDGPDLASEGIAVADARPADRVTWSLSTDRWVRPPSAAYLGDPVCHTYYNGALDEACVPVDPFAQDASAVSVALTTPALSLPEGSPGYLATVWLWSDVEPLGDAGAAEPDVLRVVVVPAGAPADAPEWEIASSLDVGKRTEGQWRLLALDLTPWRGRTIRLRFEFDTLDGQANDYQGIYLDELRVFPSCAAGGCCDSDADCDAGEAAPCSLTRCVGLSNGAGRFCARLPTEPGARCVACDEDATCEDGDACTIDTCSGGICAHSPFCCLSLPGYATSFEPDLDGWTSEDVADGTQGDDADVAEAAWRSSTTRAFEGQASAWFGVAGAGDYDTGARVNGALISPPLVVPTPPPSGIGAEVSFALWLATEWDTGDYDNPAGLDRLALSVLADGSATEIWSSDEVGGTTAGAWAPIVATLTSWIGREIQLRLSFDSGDGQRNAFEGAYIDALRVHTSCP